MHIYDWYGVLTLIVWYNFCWSSWNNINIEFHDIVQIINNLLWEKKYVSFIMLMCIYDDIRDWTFIQSLLACLQIL